MLSWSSEEFIRFKKSTTRINNEYDGAYISTFTFEGEIYWMEHNEKLKLYEYNGIESFVNDKNDKTIF